MQTDRRGFGGTWVPPRRWKQLVLASRPDVALSSTGLGRRAFSPREPEPEAALPLPVLETEADAVGFGWGEAEYVRVLVRRELARLVPEGLERTVAGAWVLVGPALEEGALVCLLDALRRWRCDRFSEGDRAMCRHLVARACFRREAAAAAAAPPPGGTTAYRDWRDAQCASAASRALAALADRLEGGAEPSGQLAAQSRLAAAQAARALSRDALVLVNRWMTESEAGCFIREAARAACVGVCMEAGTSMSARQEALDVVAVVLRRGFRTPVGMCCSDGWLECFFTVHDAVIAALHNDPLDAASNATCISTDAGGELVAVCTSTDKAKPRHATRAVKTAIMKLYESLCDGSEEEEGVLFESHPNCVVVADFVKRGYAVKAPPSAPEQHAAAAGGSRAVPNFVRRFPNLSPLDTAVSATPCATVRLTLTTGDGSGAHDSEASVYEVRPGRLAAALPAGSTAVAIFLDAGAGPLFSRVRRLRLVLRWDTGQTCSLGCDEVGGTCGEDDELLLVLARGAAHAKALVFAGRLSALYVFLGAAV